jgi:hypothetical protein
LNTRQNQNSIYVPKWGVLVFTHFRNLSPTFWGIFCIYRIRLSWGRL